MWDDDHPQLTTRSVASGKYPEFNSFAPFDCDELAGDPVAMMASSPATRIPRVLVIDDNPGDIELVRIAFEMGELAVQIEAITDGLAAVQHLMTCATTRTLPDLVFLDLNMPRANGLEVLGLMRNAGLLALIPVVVLSTSTRADDRRLCLEHGAREFHTKPGHIRELVHLVESLRAYLNPVV